MSAKVLKPELGWNNFNDTWQRVLKDNLGEEHINCDQVENVQFLSELDFQKYNVRSLQPLLFLPQIEALFMSQTEIRDPRPLMYVPNLKELHASYSVINDWRVLEYLPNLEILDLSFPRFQRKLLLPRFDKLPNLRELYINGCNIQNLDSFQSLESLEKLSLNFTTIRKEDISKFGIKHRDCLIVS